MCARCDFWVRKMGDDNTFAHSTGTRFGGVDENLCKSDDDCLWGSAQSVADGWGGMHCR